MDKKTTNIKERILQIAEFKGISKEKFTENLNQKYANYKGISKKSSPSSDVLVEILSKYPEINLEWLLTGKGEMLKNEVKKPTEADSELSVTQKELIETQRKLIEKLEEENKELKQNKSRTSEISQ